MLIELCATFKDDSPVIHVFRRPSLFTLVLFLFLAKSLTEIPDRGLASWMVKMDGSEMSQIFESSFLSCSLVGFRIQYGGVRFDTCFCS